jgi:sensor histidine kinase YesM
MSCFDRLLLSFTKERIGILNTRRNEISNYVPEEYFYLFSLSPNLITLATPSSINIVEISKDYPYLKISSSFDSKDTYYVTMLNQYIMCASSSQGVAVLDNDGNQLKVNDNLLDPNEFINCVDVVDNVIYFGTTKALKSNELSHSLTSSENIRPNIIHRFPTHDIFINGNNETITSTASQFIELEFGDDTSPVLGSGQLYINDTFVYPRKTEKIVVTNNHEIVVQPRFEEISNHKKQKILYRFQNLDARWQQAMDSRLILSNLRSGNYKLQIMGMDSEGMWSTEPIMISIQVNQIILRSVWFWLFSGLFLLLSIAIVKVRNERRYRHLGHFTESTLAEDYVKLKALEMNPHFLYNSLNSLREILKIDHDDNSDHYITQLSGQLRDIVASTKELSVSLDEELKRLSDYIKLEQKRLPGVFELSIINNSKASFASLRVPPMIIQPLVENCIWHGFNKETQDGLIQIIINLDRDMLVLVVMDNGGGFDAHELEKENQSIALENIKNRLNMLRVLKQRKYNITIRSNRESGTSVELTIPQDL